MSTVQLSKSAQRFRQLLLDRGYDYEVLEMPDSTRTADDAARAIGCTVAQIAKSLIFRGQQSDAALLAIMGGANRADVARLAALAGEPIGKADAAFVRTQTGYAIGGVPPTGHSTSVRTFIDVELLEFDEIWAAAGTPRAVFGMPPGELHELTGGQLENIRQE